MNAPARARVSAPVSEKAEGLCPVCGRAFIRENKQGRPRTYCSPGCQAKAADQRRRDNVRCVDCGGPKRSRVGERCSSCANRARSLRSARAAAERDALVAVMQQIADGDEPVARTLAVGALAGVGASSEEARP